MSQIKTTEIEGDVAVGRHATIGGNATVQGNTTIKKNLKVEGWLDAKNIKSCNKGIFGTFLKLKAAYPHVHDGWFAGVVATDKDIAELGVDATEGKGYVRLYYACGGDWVCEPGRVYEIAVDYDAVTELRNDHDALKEEHDELSEQVRRSAEHIASNEEAAKKAQDTADEAKVAASHAGEAAASVKRSLDALVGENASEAIDNFREVLSFLEGVSDDERLAGKLAELGSGVADAASLAAEAGKRVGTVSIDGLDFSAEELAAYAFAMETKPGVYRVTAAFAGAPEVQTVGTLLMMTDSMGHCVTQLLISNYHSINDDGTLNTRAHDHRKATVLERRWSSAITDGQFDGWGAWREAWNTQTAESLQRGIDEAKGAADDAATAVEQLASKRGMPDGLAPLDAGRRVPVENLPPRATVSFFHGFADVEAPEAVTVGNPEGIFHNPALGVFVAAHEGRFCNNWVGADEYGTPTANGRVPVSGKLYCDATDGVLYSLEDGALTALAAGGCDVLAQRITAAQNSIDRVSGDLTKFKISKGWPDGIAPLDADRKVPMTNLPARVYVSPFDGVTDNVGNLQQQSIDTPEKIYFYTKRNTFVALADGKYYNNWAGSDEYGEKTAEGIAPEKRKLYYNSSAGTLCLWSGEHMGMIACLVPGEAAPGMTAEEGRGLAEKIFN